MNLIRYQNTPTSSLLADPFSGFSSLSSEVNRLFDLPFFGSGTQAVQGWVPPVDIYQDKNNIVLRAELPGLKKEDINISFENDVLTISGERREEHSTEEQNQIRSEVFYGKFERSFTLPIRINSDAVNANYQDGILTVTLPKAEEAKPRKIDVSIK